MQGACGGGHDSDKRSACAAAAPRAACDCAARRARAHAALQQLKAGGRRAAPRRRVPPLRQAPSAPHPAGRTGCATSAWSSSTRLAASPCSGRPTSFGPGCAWSSAPWASSPRQRTAGTTASARSLACRACGTLSVPGTCAPAAAVRAHAGCVWGGGGQPGAPQRVPIAPSQTHPPQSTRTGLKTGKVYDAEGGPGEDVGELPGSSDRGGGGEAGGSAAGGVR